MSAMNAPVDRQAVSEPAAQLVNGSGGPGTRLVNADARFLEGQLSTISGYGPEQLQKFHEYKDRLDSAEVVR